MISPIINQTHGTGTTSPTGATGTSLTGTKTGSGSIASIDKNQFLKLLVTQLKNQDPNSPLSPNEFAAQLAQFTSVEQLIQLNDGMANQSVAVQMSTLAGQASLGASLIGRQVVAEGHQVTIPKTGPGHIRVEVGTGGGVGTLTITDSSGHVVGTRKLGQIPAGRQTLTLPTDLPPGDYSYALDVKDASNKSVTVSTFTTGTVDAVHFDNGQIVLRMGGIKVLLGDVAEIEQAASSNTPALP